MFNTTFLIIYSVLSFVILFAITFFVMNRRQSEKVSILASLIPPLIILSVIIFIGNLGFKFNPHYSPTGSAEKYGLFEISFNVPLDSDGRGTDEDVCITYTEPDIDLEEYNNSMVYEKDEHGNELDSDAPIEVMGVDVRSEDELEEHEEMDHNHGVVRFPTEKLAGDICTSKNLVDVDDTTDYPEVLIYKAKADPTKFFSLFSLGAKETYYVVKVEN